MDKLIGTISNSGSLTGTLNITANDYDLLKNKPSIENVELVGNKNFIDLGLTPMTNSQIETLIGG